MARKKMLCPFSDKACKNCSLYIGRHYLLCDKTRYRGHVDDERSPKKDGRVISGKRDLSVPELEYKEELDLFTRLQ